MLNPLWRHEVRERSLVVSLPETYRCLGWAPLGGVFARTDVIINHQLVMGDLPVTQAPRRSLAALARAMGCLPHRAVAMMTGVPI